MRKIIVTTFLSMDGVLQAPGGPHEDSTGGFKWGGWTFPYADNTSNETMSKIMSSPFDLLLGRRTYEIFAAYWPYNDDNPIGKTYNSIQKYVVSHSQIELPWKNSNLITGDVVQSLKKLKQQDGPDLLVNGSGGLAQTLFANQLVDVLHTWVYPVTFGTGKKLFQEGTQPVKWKLTDTSITGTGVIIASYIPDGSIQSGSYVSDEISQAEIARREKWAREDRESTKS